MAPNNNMEDVDPMRGTKWWVLAVVAATSAGSAMAQGAVADSRWTVSAEMLLAWFKDSPTPVPIITDYYLDAPGVNVLLGGGSVNTNPNAGFRMTGAYRVDSRWGIELGGFYIPSRSTTSGVSSSGQPGSVDLLLPYIDASTGREDVSYISDAPDYSGQAQATLDNDLGGFELNATWALAPHADWRTSLLGGFRFLQLRETYTITTSSPYVAPNPADIWNTTDNFDARNRFYGLQVGVRTAYDKGPWVVGLAGKVALGSMQQRVSINGFLETNDFNGFGAAQYFPGGYYALPSNSGDHSRNTFAVVPEIGINVGYRLTPQLTAFLGYSFLYASSVVRPGEQVDRTINTTQNVAWAGDTTLHPTGPAQPSFSFDTTSFWSQTFSIGVALRF